MACITRTEATVLQNLTPKYREDEFEITNVNEDKAKKSIMLERICAYKTMLPKREPSYMSPIRRWEQLAGFQTPIRWINFISISLVNIITYPWFFYELIFHIEKFGWKTITFSTFMALCAGFGVTAGAHRYWSHKSFKARMPFKIILLLCYSVAGQNNIYDWVRDHRVHHKYSETSADPHNANRGFFFSHVGWLMMKKHPDVIRAGNKIDMSDITNDTFIQFHTRYFKIFKLLCCFVLPTLIPIYFWNETWSMTIMSQSFRYLTSLNFTWSVNSFAHIWGNKPYDRNIMPAENIGVSICALGEGWHNYHHTFPWDYKAAELPYSFNMTTMILDMFAGLGWVYDRKVASHSLIKSIAERKGDRTHQIHFDK